MTDERFVTAVDLARRLLVTRKTIYTWARSGLLPMPVKFGVLSRWRWSDVQAALDRLPQRVGRKAEAGVG
jgi:predicted DNA-binding transcriptional regulator AlpA